MKRTVSAAALLFCLLCGLMLFAGTGFAARRDAAAARLTDPDGPVIGIAYKGDRHAHPENSEGAILAAAASLDFVAVDVSRTKDGALVLCEANSAARMLGANSEAVADRTLEELSALPLKNRNGGKNNLPTEEGLLTVAQLFVLAAENDFVPVLTADASLAADVAAAITSAGAEKTAALLLTGKSKEIRNAVQALGDRYIVLTEKRSNVLFDVLGFASAMEKSGVSGINLKTTNRYGVIFNQTVLGRFAGRMRAVANTAESATCGAREDTVKWWDDLISRGYSVIVTDDPQQFAAYQADADAARARLQSLYDTVGDTWRLPAFKDTVLNDYKKAFTDAETQATALLSDESSSLQDLRDCFTALRAAMDAIDLNYEALEAGTAGKAVTLPRILLCAAAAAVVVWVQVFFYKKRKKA